MISLRRLHSWNSRVNLLKWSLPERLGLNVEFRCHNSNCSDNTCTIIGLQQRTFTTTLFTPEEKIVGAESHQCPALEENTQPPMLKVDKMDAASSNSPTHTSSKRNHPRPPQSMVPLSQHVRAIMRDVQIG